MRLDVRYGSVADITARQQLVRLVPRTDIRGCDASLIRAGGYVGAVDPTLLRSRRVGDLHPTFFAAHNAELCGLWHNADDSR